MTKPEKKLSQYKTKMSKFSIYADGKKIVDDLNLIIPIFMYIKYGGNQNLYLSNTENDILDVQKENDKSYVIACNILHFNELIKSYKSESEIFRLYYEGKPTNVVIKTKGTDVYLEFTSTNKEEKKRGIIGTMRDFIQQPLPDFKNPDFEFESDPTKIFILSYKTEDGSWYQRVII